tara:strand:+ start:167 stop:787 length:621 start_codon:yes stop_codon:yes gene_type:complete
MNIVAKKKKKKYNKLFKNKEEDEEEVDEISSEPKIKSVGNKIYFYDDVESDNVLELKNCICELNNTLITESMKYDFDPVIHLHIYSYGGDVFMGLSMYDFIKENKIPIYTYIDGMIASSATFIFLAGKRRFMSENAMVLIHQISTSFWGKFEDLKDEYSNSQKIMDIVKRIYKKNTTMSKNQMKNILQRELYLNYEACKEIQFITD